MNDLCEYVKRRVSASEATPVSGPAAAAAVAVKSATPTPVGSLARRKSQPELTLAAQLAALQPQHSAAAGGATAAADQAALNAMKQEVLTAFRAELQAAKSEILEGICVGPSPFASE